MLVVVTVVGFLIHLYSVGFMRGTKGYARFFAYMNLFVASMLMLVLADNLVFLYLGWEGVGLTSFLLIGFWYRERSNGNAARKAFVVTRIGDAALAVGLALVFSRLGTLDIQEVLNRSGQLWTTGEPVAVAAAALLLTGAVGKSAQLPLHVWLPDAMAGPTPVSALLHAATMVTAGVYLLARTETLFSLAPSVRLWVGVLGTVTLLIAASSALVQRDIKRVLAYSTMSQIGYMFLALGAGAGAAAVFHLATHAFFKALLFLGAGVVLLSTDHERDIFQMGGLRKQQPLVFWSFLIGAASLAGVPWLTAGFYSKEWILAEVGAMEGGVALWWAGWFGVVLTALYAFRLVFLVFFGEARKPHRDHRPGWILGVPLVVLALLSVTAGWLEPIVSPWLLFGAGEGLRAHATTAEQWSSAAASLSGIGLAYVFFGRKRTLRVPPLLGRVRAFLMSGWGLDLFYEAVFVWPFLALARAGRKDVLDRLIRGPIVWSDGLHRRLSAIQSGRLRWYAAVTFAGWLLLVAMVIWT
jgi:NADH-quinone oxidoreductase subunit L